MSGAEEQPTLSTTNDKNYQPQGALRVLRFALAAGALFAAEELATVLFLRNESNPDAFWLPLLVLCSGASLVAVDQAPADAACDDAEYMPAAFAELELLPQPHGVDLSRVRLTDVCGVRRR